MEFEPKASSQTSRRLATIAALPEHKRFEPSKRQPLVWLHDKERSLHRQKLITLVPLLPKTVALNLGKTSLLAKSQ